MSTLHTYIYVRLRIIDAVMGLCMTGITKAFIQIQYWPTLDQFGHIESLIYTRLVDWRHTRMHMSNIQLTCWACLNLDQARTSRIYLNILTVGLIHVPRKAFWNRKWHYGYLMLLAWTICPLYMYVIICKRFNVVSSTKSI